ncbi:MAG: Mut7-C RNAse domain-containing protein [Betaproteobacteria bacterium]
MATARFLFHEPLSAFLKRERRGQAFAYDCARAASLKNAIEALGVPHTEAGAITVNGAPATLQRTVREGDVVEIYPVTNEEFHSFVFLADAHLGGLARFLRMLGFDTLHDQAMHDEAIRRIAAEEGRVVLTRDRELLKCRDIARGCYVRALKAEAQLREVAARYRLAARARPFTLCLRCNLPLAPLQKAAVAGSVPEKVFLLNESFSGCAGCARIYWPGSHYQRMQAALEAALPSS